MELYNVKEKFEDLVDEIEDNNPKGIRLADLYIKYLLLETMEEIRVSLNGIWIAIQDK